MFCSSTSHRFTPLSRAMQDEERLAAEVAKLEKRRADVAALKFDEKIKELNASIQAQKVSLADAKRERDGLSSMAGVAGQAQLLERDAAEKSSSVKAVYAQCLPQLQELYGEQVRLAQACILRVLFMMRISAACAGAAAGGAEGELGQPLSFIAAGCCHLRVQPSQASRCGCCARCTLV